MCSKRTLVRATSFKTQELFKFRAFNVVAILHYKEVFAALLTPRRCPFGIHRIERSRGFGANPHRDIGGAVIKRRGKLYIVEHFKRGLASLRLRATIVIGLLIALAGCGLPASAPTSIELTKSSNGGDFNYTVINLDAHIISILDQYHPSFGPVFKKAHYVATNALHPGDAIAITVYETGGQTLFPPPAVVPGAVATTTPIGAVATGASNIPPQIVETDGTIFVPFAGRVKVAGLTPGQAGTLIEKDLQGKAVSPQVLVSLVNNIGNVVTVSGEVNSAHAVPLSSHGERLLDVIAAAGGAKYPAYEIYVQVVRKGQVGNVLLQTIVNNPAENIIVEPRDQIYLTRNPRTFAVLGATQRVALYPFSNEKVTLAEAIAQAGGPVDFSGDPGGVYLFRFEPWFIAKDLVDPQYVASLGSDPPRFVPILYRIDMRDAQGYFLAQAFQMQDKDVVLITNAAGAQLQKLLTMVSTFTGVAYDWRVYTLLK
jgi:polysaccharide export outer membrane protein